MRNFFIFNFLLVGFCCFSQNSIAFLGSTELSEPMKVKKERISSTSPFDFENGLLIVDAVVDGIKGKYILDTGAPSLILNSTDNTNPKTISALSLNTSLEIGEVLVKSFQWGSLVRKNIESYSLDISHLNRRQNSDLKGLIGYRVLKNNAIFVDFEKSEISLLSKKEIKKEINSDENIISIPLTMKGHLPVLKLKINGRTYRFGLDTGAEKNVICKELFAKTNPENIKYELVQGLDGGIRKTASGEIEKLKVKNLELEQMEFLYSDLTHLNSSDPGYQIDGLLGLPFFQNRKFIIDYSSEKLYIWE